MEKEKIAKNVRHGVYQSQRCVFLAHWVENWNWLLLRAISLREDPRRRVWWFWAWPIVAAVSVLYLLGHKAYDEVDTFWHRGRTECHTWLLRNFGWHFAISSCRKKIYRRILEAVRDAQNSRVKVVGLGALTKAEWLTEGGERIVRDLAGELKVSIVHGDTLTAACVIARAGQIVGEFFLAGKPILLTGATSKIGRAVALTLARDGHNLYLLTKSEKRFLKIQEEAGQFGDRLYRVEHPARTSACALWIIGKSKPGGRELMKYAPWGTIFLNFNVPDPMTERLLKKRPDIRHFEGALMNYDPGSMKMRFTMRLLPGMMYACHVATIVHAAKGWRHHEVGEIDLKKLEEVWQAAVEMGFFLPPLLSGLYPR